MNVLEALSLLALGEMSEEPIGDGASILKIAEVPEFTWILQRYEDGTATLEQLT